MYFKYKQVQLSLLGQLKLFTNFTINFNLLEGLYVLSQGEKGEPGQTVDGVVGDKGEKGDPGVGIAGDKGEPGLTGEDGAKGTMGLHVHLYMRTCMQ